MGRSDQPLTSGPHSQLQSSPGGPKTQTVLKGSSQHAMWRVESQGHLTCTVNEVARGKVGPKIRSACWGPLAHRVGQMKSSFPNSTGVSRQQTLGMRRSWGWWGFRELKDLPLHMPPSFQGRWEKTDLPLCETWCTLNDLFQVTIWWTS